MLLTTPRAFLLTSTFLFAPASALAQVQAEPASETGESRQARDATSLEKLTVFGTRQLAAPDETTTNVAVLSSEEMDARFVTDMRELVRGEAGITVQRQTSGTDPFNTYGGFTIRGVGGNRVQMLVDGARVPERIIDGTRDYLDFNFTRQADIVRGPGSVLWGADALGGIVALETIDPEDILGGRQSGGEARTAYDSLDDELNNSLTYARRLSPELAVLGGIAYTAADEAEFSNARADGGIYGCPRNIAFGATPCNALDPTDKSSYRALGKAVYTPGADHRFEVTADYLSRDIDVQYDQVLGPVFSTMTGAPTGEFVNDYDRNLDLHRGRFAVEHEWQIGAALIDRLDWSLSYSPNGYERTGVRRAVSAAGEDVVENDYLSYSEDFFELDLQVGSPGTELEFAL